MIFWAQLFALFCIFFWGGNLDQFLPNFDIGRNKSWFTLAIDRLNMIGFMMFPLVKSLEWIIPPSDELTFVKAQAQGCTKWMWVSTLLKTIWLIHPPEVLSLSPLLLNVHILWRQFTGCNIMQGVFVGLCIFLSSNGSMITPASQLKIDLLCVAKKGYNPWCISPLVEQLWSACKPRSTTPPVAQVFPANWLPR